MKKSVDYLVEYAKAQVGRPYWMGTYGQIADKSLLAYKRTQYPVGYPDPGVPAFESQLGQKVHDCNGLVYAASVCKTPDSKPSEYPSPYYGVPKLYQHCEETSQVTMFTNPVKGMLFFRNAFGHVGIYGGDGYMYHAKGHKWGVVKEKFNYKEWDYYGKFREMYDYPGDVKIEVSLPPTIQKGMKGSTVATWQALLLISGYKLPKYGADGDFGDETYAATVAWQKDKGILPDGIVGKDSWTWRLNEI